MKKLYSFFSIVLLATLFLGVMATVALAGGGQVTNQERGEAGEGEVVQHCVGLQLEVPGVCPYGPGL